MVSAIAQFALIIMLPAALSLALTYLGEGDISRPWLFFLVATVILYIVYVAVFYAIAATLRGGFAISKPDPSSPARVRSLTPNLLIFYAKPLLVFTVLSVPVAFGLVRLFHKP
jgi:hypothetical protein